MTKAALQVAAIVAAYASAASAERLTGWHRAMNIAVAVFSAGLGLHVIAAQWLS